MPYKDPEIRKAKAKEASRRSYLRNKEKVAAKNKAWREANPEKQREYQRNSYHKHREKNLERMSRFRAGHPDWESQWRAENNDKVREIKRRYLANGGADTQNAWRERNPDRVRQYEKAWRVANPDKLAEKGARRRARKRGAVVERVDRAAIIARDQRICHICGGYVADNLTLDHVIPLARGGKHAADNLKVAHRSCNSRKGARLPN